MTLSRRRFIQISAAFAAAPLIAFRRPQSEESDPPETAANRVIAAFPAPIRRYAAASAPMVRRIEADTMLHQLDHIDTGDGGAWIALADESGALIGWSPAGAWRSAR